MTPSEIKSGMTFGHWEVIKFDHTNEHRIKYYLCKCGVCGTIRPVRASALLNGTSTSCSKECSKSLVGEKCGRWQVLKRDKNRPSYYICKCECGTQRSVFSSSLKNGLSKSCGCLQSENTKKKNTENAESHIGERYVKLTVIEPILKGKDYYYLCQCDCGNQITVIGKNLFSGNTSSCGCINSKANAEMALLLKRLNIPFKPEYKFQDCADKRPLPFDFAIFNREDELIGLIENNGSQHYSSRGTGWNTPERLIYTQKHDYIKQNFCEENHIPLLIIPYQFFDRLEDFLITSDFWNIIIRSFND